MHVHVKRGPERCVCVDMFLTVLTLFGVFQDINAGKSFLNFVNNSNTSIHLLRKEGKKTLMQNFHDATTTDTG